MNNFNYNIMTHNEKDLLLKDLCARLPYNVKIKIKTYEDIDEIDSIGTLRQLNKQYFWILEDEYERCIEYNKPYLFPLSSMTEEQIKEFNSITQKCSTYIGKSILLTDFCNKHHIDWRGLIPMDLAIDATGLNIY